MLLASLISAPLLGADQKASHPGSDDEVVSSPFADYGEFQSGDDEAEDEKFFQQGRFFGVGIGAGFTSPTGNAGKLYQGGFPTLDLRLLYWFDFNFALSLGIQTSKHSYDVQPDGLTSVNLFRLMTQIKYYFDTRDTSAPITFVGPHLIAGVGMYKRTDNLGSGTGSSSTGGAIQEEQAVGFNAGAGFELTIRPKKTYFDIEGVAHFVSFNDQFDSRFTKAGIPDKTGTWYSVTASLLFTW